ncbi:unnamed protein product [Paramecium sonneborni]|uniref:Uncharacterized protein n=1 Tax=Paramecium sonneborni TaxID=65129 RepID=A0A8S1KJV8_9CILI|nr:unnamed protein product [Paramecium sonneborni]CAD8051196.1 unnamed protein product [Paramecium sonneborni]
MNRCLQEEEESNNQTQDGYNNQILLPSVGFSCKTTFSIENTRFNSSLQVQPDKFQSKSKSKQEMITFEKKLKIQKNIHKKLKKNHKTQKVLNIILDEIQNLETQVHLDISFNKIQYVQKFKVLIKNLENTLENLKQELLVKVYQQDIHGTSQ